MNQKSRVADSPHGCGLFKHAPGDQLLSSRNVQRSWQGYAGAKRSLPQNLIQTLRTGKCQHRMICTAHGPSSGPRGGEVTIYRAICVLHEEVNLRLPFRVARVRLGQLLRDLTSIRRPARWPMR